MGISIKQVIMIPYVYLLINAMAAFWLHQSGETFNGSSGLMKMVLVITSGVGFLNLIAFTIYAITQLVWWQPIVALLVVSMIAPFAIIIFNFLPRFIVDVLMIIALLVCLIFMYGTV